MEDFEILPDPAKDTLIDEFDDYAAECESALNITLVRIENMKRAYARVHERNPFDRIEYRLKTFESAVKKCSRRGHEVSMESIRTRMFDIAGIRIITKFRDEIEIVERLIEKIPGINIVSRKDYVNNPKPNGYSSLHLGTQVEISTISGGSKLIPVEIQIRDKAQNLWATIEHTIKYKKERPSPKASEYFKRIAGLLAEFDQVAMELRDYSEIAADPVLDELSNSISTVVAH